jgi:hypothetical protein
MKKNNEGNIVKLKLYCLKSSSIPLQIKVKLLPAIMTCQRKVVVYSPAKHNKAKPSNRPIGNSTRAYNTSLFKFGLSNNVSKFSDA